MAGYVQSAKGKIHSLLSLNDNHLQENICPKTTLSAWTFSGQELRMAINGEIILCPSIELSDVCNLNCPYCYVEDKYSSSKNKSQVGLTIGETKKIIDTLIFYGAKTINIIGAGEPTIDPNFIAIVDHIYTAGATPLVATNGIRFADSEELACQLFERNCNIVLKYNSQDIRLQDELVGRIGYAEKRDKALEILIDTGFNKSKPTRLAINTLLMRANYKELTDIYEFCLQKNITLIAGDYMPTGRTEDGVFQGHAALDYNEGDLQHAKLYEPISQDERRKLWSDITKINSQHGYMTAKYPAYISGLPCVQSLGLTIDYLGNVWPCPARNQIINKKLAPQALGDVKLMKTANEIFEIWQNHAYMKEVRQEYLGNCPYKKILYEADFTGGCNEEFNNDNSQDL